MEKELAAIIDKIKESGEKEAQMLVGKGAFEAEKLRKESQHAIDREKEAISKEKRREIDVAQKRVLSEAKLTARKMELDAREAEMKAVFDEALKRMAAFTPDKYTAYLVKGLQGAIPSLGTEMKLECLAKDKELAASAASRAGVKAAVSATLTGVTGGLVAYSKNLENRMDLTFENTLALKEESLRKEVSKILFGEVQKVD